ncbi:MAG: GntR family transcriptional regulator [Planctomycetes bacterium]|nr:GntR family transcriptional regulator [Planctomycetota bacterium]
MSSALSIDKTSPVPIYTQLSAAIRARVDQGTYAAGTKLPSEAALARSLGISPMTVRQAYGELASSGLVHRRHGKGTFIQRPPDSRPARTSTDLLLVFTTFSAMPYHHRLVAAMAEACDASGWNLHLSCHRERGLDHQANAVIGGLIRERQVDAVLAAGPVGDEDLDRLAAARMPVLLLDRESARPGVCTVRFDDHAFLRRALATLARRGCRRPALVNGPPAEPGTSFTSRGDRLAAALPAACTDAGLPWDPGLVATCLGYGEAAAETATRRLLELPLPPDALVAHGDSGARGARRALAARGLDLPVLVFADDPADPGASPAKPFAALAAAAVALLAQLVAGRTPASPHIIVPLPPESP